MRLEACYFDEDGSIRGGRWARMAAVLERTAAEHCAGWTRKIDRLGPARLGVAGVPGHKANTHKLRHWVRIISAAPDHDQILLIDADTMILRPLEDVWRWEFDLAFTEKTHVFPFNLGVLFVRVNAKTRQFFGQWLEENERLFHAGEDGARKWRRQYGGINQSAFGRLRERGALEGLTVLPLACAEWNCEESAWETAGHDARILHIKGALRRAIFGEQLAPAWLSPLVQRWRAADRGEGIVHG